jgi:predicted  nucleic acid-binding Zn-ribbon protein
MNPSEKKEGGKNDRRTRSQLQEALSKAQKVINDREKEIVSIQKKLDEAKAEIEALEEKSKEFESMKAEIEKNSREASPKQQALEKRIKEYKKTITDLRKQIENGEQANMLIPEFISTKNKASFLIELYTDQSHLPGRIKYIPADIEVDEPAKKSEKFKGLDIDFIKAYISKHLPINREEQAEQPLPDVADQIEPLLPTAAATVGARRISLRDFNLVAIDASGRTNVVQHDQPFQLKLTFDPTDVTTQIGPKLAYNTSIYAKRIGGGPRQLAGQTSGNIEVAGLFTTAVKSRPLPAGTYKLEAIATFSTIANEFPEFRGFQESSLIHVC